MSKNFKTISIGAIFLTFCFFGLQSASAATLYLSADKQFVGMGDTFETTVKIDSEDAGINAGQATVKFPKEIVEVQSIDRSDSVFNFWLEDPAFSNEEGKVTFIGGSNSGLSGKSLKVLKINFKVKGTGLIKFVFTDGAIASSNGSGTNVLSTMLGLEITSSPGSGVTKIVPPPTQITRPAETAQNLPIKPVLKVQLYPDPEKWYNSTDNFIAQWELPADVSNVNTAIDQDVSNNSQAGEGLFESKVFPAIKTDGIWYLHIRFKNNIGWGPVANYRLAIDTAPPLGFQATVSEGESTDNPAPHLQFESSDALSGLKEYQVRIGEGDTIKIPAADFNGTFQLPLQSPGKRQITIRATDEAGNSSESIVDLDIIPIVSPVITFVTKELFSDEEKGMTIKGTALPDIDVLVSAYRGEALVAKDKVRSDEKGNWEFSFDQQFKNGQYVLTAQSQDLRGALSLEVKSGGITVKSKPIIQIGKFQLGMGGALIFLLLVIAGGFGSGAWYYKKRQEKLSLRLVVVDNEMAKVFKIISDDIEKLQQSIETSTKADEDFLIKKLKESVKKMEGYLKKQVDNVKK